MRFYMGTNGLIAQRLMGATIAGQRSAAPYSRRRFRVFDDVEILADLPQPRWPLHPAPRLLERLENYIRRLADAYGTGVATFCRYGLACELRDLERCAHDPPRLMLERLSAGTGQSIHRLRNMTDARCHARRKVALSWMIRSDPEIVHKWAPKVSGHTEFVDGI